MRDVGTLELQNKRRSAFNIKPFLTWSSDFFTFTGYSVLNLQRKYSQGNQIKTSLFELLKTEKNAENAASTSKKAEPKRLVKT